MGKTHLVLVVVFCCFLTSNCAGKTSNTANQFGIFRVLKDQSTVEMDGEITDSTLRNFKKMISKFPNIKKIIMKEVPGSSADEVNIAVARLVHKMDISIHLADNGLVASGGTDFFLAGKVRTKGSNTKIGVHSWSDEGVEATKFPKGDPVHKLYIDYYTSVGFSKKAAEDFYYFTIFAAPAESIHWMTEAELKKYGILTGIGEEK